MLRNVGLPILRDFSKRWALAPADCSALSALPIQHVCQALLLRHAPASTVAGSSVESLKDDIIIVPMPQLSPHMTSGKISKWLKGAGDEIATYDVIFEVETESLSEEAYKVGDFAGSVTMLVEAQEEGYLTKILVDEGVEVAVNEPVAIMCELEETVQNMPEEVDELLREQKNMKRLTWQSYLKEGEGSKGCS